MAQSDEARIRPDVLQAALTHKINKQLQQLTEQMSNLVGLMGQQIPEGVIEPLHKMTVTSNPQTAKPPYSNKPWFGVKITNDGPNMVWVVVNTGYSSQPVEVQAGETWGPHFNTAKITDLYLYCDAGEHAVVRIRGER